MCHRPTAQNGFTLIELSIVLVIIGLIVGGVLVGKDLIRAAEARAQIAQIEKMNQGVNTFRGKFGMLPGDIQATTAAQFGLTVGSGCTGTQGLRDGNGTIEGVAPNYYSQAIQETGLFWQDLSSQKLIDTTIPNGGITDIGCSGCPVVSVTNLPKYFPTAALGNGNYISVYGTNGINWLAVSAITGIVTCANPQGAARIPVIQAYSIDKKIDDGVPLTGIVQATGATQTVVQAAYNSWGPDPLQCFYSNPVYAPPGGVYSISASTGGDNSNLPNCSLSFKIQ